MRRTGESFIRLRFIAIFIEVAFFSIRRRAFLTFSLCPFSLSLPHHFISVVIDAVVAVEVSENVGLKEPVGSVEVAGTISDKPPVVTAEEAVVISEAPPVAITTSMAFPSIMHKDAFLIFRALCKLSMKGLHESDESGSLSDPIALQNK